MVELTTKHPKIGLKNCKKKGLEFEYFVWNYCLCWKIKIDRDKSIDKLKVEVKEEPEVPLKKRKHELKAAAGGDDQNDDQQMEVTENGADEEASDAEKKSKKSKKKKNKEKEKEVEND